MPTKPTLLRSADNKVWGAEGEKTTPGSARIKAGYAVDNLPSHSELNKLLNNLFEYVDFIDVGGMTGIIRFDTIEALAAIDDTQYLDLQHFIVSGFGIYQLDQSDITSLADGENVIALLSGSRLHRIIYDVDTSLSLLEYELAFIQKNLKKLQNIEKVFRNTVSLDFGSISANSTSDLEFDFDFARKQDLIQITPQTALNSGLIIAGAWVANENKITLRLANITGSPINPSAIVFNVILTK